MTEPAPHLLVVDDEPSMLMLVERLLSKARYRVTTCASATEALRLLVRNAYDGVITDAVMPEMTGYDLVKAIRRQPLLSRLPVVMLTRKRQPDDVRKALEAGVSDYVVKPIDEHLLLDKVGLALTRSADRHVYQLYLSGAEAQARMNVPVTVVSVSETDILIRVPFALGSDTPVELRVSLFDQVGMAQPFLKLIQCDAESPDVGSGFLARFVFVGAPEADIKKLRAWLQRESIRRKK
jgi:CheY-like chemotaxis protein